MVHGFGLLRRGMLLGVLACLAAVGLAIPTTAAAKVTSLTSCGTLSSPGKYRLDADITTSAARCFGITAIGVRLNLNGHTITGDGGAGIAVVNGASNAKIVGPGTLTGWSHGITLSGAGNGSVRGVTATNNVTGIFIFSGRNSVRGNVATDNVVGIFAAPGMTDNTIIGNFAHDNTVADLFDDDPNCDNNVWRGNDFGTATQSCIH